jgi:hypothetical protein
MRMGAECWQQHVSAFQLASLPCGQVQADGVAQRIDHRMDFAAQSAFAAADGLLAAFFLRAPDACW